MDVIKRFINKKAVLIYMVKKKKSYTNDFRDIAQISMGAGMVGTMTPLISNPSAGNIENAVHGMVGFSILAPIATVGFNAIDNIGKKKKKK